MHTCTAPSALPGFFSCHHVPFIANVGFNCQLDFLGFSMACMQVWWAAVAGAQGHSHLEQWLTAKLLTFSDFIKNQSVEIVI
jgi:hypothetical protein